MAEWPSGLERWLGLATGRSRPGSNPTEETLKAVRPFYLVSMSGEVKYPTSLRWNV